MIPYYAACYLPIDILCEMPACATIASCPGAQCKLFKTHTCVWIGLKCEKRYWASNSGQSRADRGSGSRSSSSVWGGCFSGRIRLLKDMGKVASAWSQVSETALHEDEFRITDKSTASLETPAELSLAPHAAR